MIHWDSCASCSYLFRGELDIVNSHRISLNHTTYLTLVTNKQLSHLTLTIIIKTCSDLEADVLLDLQLFQVLATQDSPL